MDLLDGDGDGDGDGTGMNPRWRMSAAPILVALGAPVRRRDVVAVDGAVWAAVAEMLAAPVGWQRLLALAPFPDNVGRSTITLLALVKSRLRLRVLLMQLGCQRGVNKQLSNARMSLMVVSRGRSRDVVAFSMWST